jgi:hypothetical protein
LLHWPVTRAMPFIALFSVDCPFIDIVTLDVNDVRKVEYPKVNMASVDSGYIAVFHTCRCSMLLHDQTVDKSFWVGNPFQIGGYGCLARMQ